jgi:hypothetical protein
VDQGAVVGHEVGLGEVDGELGHDASKAE